MHGIVRTLWAGRLCEGQYIDDIKHGYFRYRWNSGWCEEIFYDNGKPTGTYTVHHIDGSLWERGTYDEKGHRHATEYHEDNLCRGDYIPAGYEPADKTEEENEDGQALGSAQEAAGATGDPAPASPVKQAEN